ncbi:MAG: tetratricopeptide repeat protein [Brevinemataceae bacterium]
MNWTLENVLNTLLKKRIIVVGILSSILLVSIFAGVSYQRNVDRQEVAKALFDKSWQKIMYSIQLLQSSLQQKNMSSETQAKQLFQEGISDLDILIEDYPDTVSAARAALLVRTISSEPSFLSLLDEELVQRISAPEYTDIVARKHSSFWGAALDIIEGIGMERQSDMTSAIQLYQSALKKDKKKYMNDYIYILIARSYELIEKNQDALYYYKQLFNLYPDSPWASVAVAKIYLLNNSLESVATPSGSVSQ